MATNGEHGALDRAVNHAIDELRPRLEVALRRGYYGRVTLDLSFQDGVLQHVKAADEKISKART